jgi:UDP-N-acetylglucosamine--N-acetylmuramyl-(pentapeptide) pyrophosphoryl-undecaprenol N-acetylglucosamine transferase
MGRANRLLAPRVTRIATSFPQVQGLKQADVARTAFTGNPVRLDVVKLRDLPYPAPTGTINLLVTGGSQGARLLSETVPAAISLLAEPIRNRLKVEQQTRQESLDNARRIYADAAVEAQVAPFFRDMASRLEHAHLVIGRAGASTVCELAVAGLPSILVPLKIAADDHQRFNARLLTEAGAAQVINEDDLTVDSLAELLQAMLSDPAGLSRRAAAAHAAATPDAASKLADLVEQTARA